MQRGIAHETLTVSQQRNFFCGQFVEFIHERINLSVKRRAFVRVKVFVLIGARVEVEGTGVCLCRRKLARMSKVAAGDGSNLCGFERDHRCRMAVERDKFHLVGFAVFVNVNDCACITSLNSFSWDWGC